MYTQPTTTLSISILLYQPSYINKDQISSVCTNFYIPIKELDETGFFKQKELSYPYTQQS